MSKASHEQVIRFLGRLAVALAEQRVRITWKADDEIASMGWTRSDALHELELLGAADLLRTEPAASPEWGLIWVFCPLAWELDRHLWIRLVERDDQTFLVSFHIAEREPWS